jgi:16S rRNA (uracil1498-N3)-methyltransferase
MPHFYVPPQNITGKTFRITGEDVHYLATVRRYAKGDKLKLFDGKGGTMTGVIDSVSKEEITGTLVAAEGPSGKGADIHIYQAVPKGDRFDWLVEKAAELGVAKITPLITERSVIRDVSAQKLERWRRLAKAACQQCGRAGLLGIEEPLEFGPALKAAGQSGAFNIVPWEAEGSRTVAEAFQGRREKTVNVFIGPEGGFSVKEIELAKASGVETVTLGARILRAETAGILAAVLVLNQSGEYDKA